MKRGGYGKPWRKPADGWFVPQKLYLGGLYQHHRSALDGLTRYVNNTEITLQQNQRGRAMTRTTPETGVDCESHIPNGLPQTPWIGTGDNQFLPNAFVNTFRNAGPMDMGANKRVMGMKNVHAVRQHHGDFPFTKEDPTWCSSVAYTLSGYDVFNYTSFVPAQTASPQTKYLVRSYACDWSYKQTPVSAGTGVNKYEQTASLSGAVSVDAHSGKRTHTLLSEQDTLSVVDSPGGYTSGYHTVVSGGAATVTAYDGAGATTAYSYASGYPTVLDFLADMDFATGTPVIPNNYFGNTGGGSPVPNTTLLDFINWWIITFAAPGTVTPLAACTNRNSYSSTGAADILAPVRSPRTVSLTWTRTATTFTWEFHYADGGNSDPSLDVTCDFTGTITLSSANTAADVKADAEALLAYWDLTDDVVYPWRVDGIWGVAPKMSRDEIAADVSPTGFFPATVDDYRSPIADVNGNAAFSLNWQSTWAQTAWFDPNVYGFRFPFGTDRYTAAATALEQTVATGKILGMPMPRAFMDADSAIYGNGPADDGVYQDYFDPRAEIWRRCIREIPSTQVDWYRWGWGEWNSDRRGNTGAQLPLAATQWTNNFEAIGRRAYAHMVHNDLTAYDSPPDTQSYRQGAFWASKCAVVLELWPSQNLFRPAREDRFLFDQSFVYCVADLVGSGTGATFTLTDWNATNVSLSDTTGIWGGTDVGGFYEITQVGYTVTLGAKILDLPAGTIQPGFGKLRFPTCKAILGRTEVSSITDNGDGTCTLNLATAENYILTGDAIDTCSTAISYDGNGNRVSETMTVIASNKAVTVISSTQLKITASLASLSGTGYIVSHGVTMSGSTTQAWYWDDSGRKGDFATYEWVDDKRTNGERARLDGVLDCAGSAVSRPAANLGFASFSQTQQRLKFSPCCPSIVAITPNGETWTNALVIPFPATFTFDALYGASWQAEIEQCMNDVIWQSPARACGAETWVRDDGTCNYDYAYPPQVEALVELPTYGGIGENETAPTPPSPGLGHNSPVTYVDGLFPPGGIPSNADGQTGGAWTPWAYRIKIEGTCTSCPKGFDYVGTENLPCFTITYVNAGELPAAGPLGGLEGLI